MTSQTTESKIKLLQQRIAEKSRETKYAGEVAAGAYIVDQLLDTAIWAVDNYWNVPPDKSSRK